MKEHELTRGMQPSERASDEELVDLARAGNAYDTRPFEILVRRHQSFVAANCRAIVRSPTTLTIWRRRSSSKPSSGCAASNAAPPSGRGCIASR